MKEIIARMYNITNEDVFEILTKYVMLFSYDYCFSEVVFMMLIPCIMLVLIDSILSYKMK